jgi:hypothetical protein
MFYGLLGYFGTTPVRQTPFRQTTFRQKTFRQNLKIDFSSKDVSSNDFLSKYHFCQNIIFVKISFSSKFHLFRAARHGAAFMYFWYPVGSPNGVSPNGVSPNGSLPKEYKHGNLPKWRFAEQRFAECGILPKQLG